MIIIKTLITFALQSLIAPLFVAVAFYIQETAAEVVVCIHFELLIYSQLNWRLPKVME
jgi:hypothetical protein